MKLAICNSRLFLLLAVLAAAGTGAHAQSDLRQWRESTKKAYNECSYSMSAALTFEEASRYARTKACVETALADESSSPKAVGAAAKPPTAALVRDYHAAWTAAMQALPRLQYGAKLNAERVDQAASLKLDELWARIEAEGNL